MQDLRLIGVHEDGHHLLLVRRRGPALPPPPRRGAAGRGPTRPSPAGPAADRDRRRTAPPRGPGPHPSRAVRPRRSPTGPAGPSRRCGASRAPSSPSASTSPNPARPCAVGRPRRRARGRRRADAGPGRRAAQGPRRRRTTSQWDSSRDRGRPLDRARDLRRRRSRAHGDLALRALGGSLLALERRGSLAQRGGRGRPASRRRTSAAAADHAVYDVEADGGLEGRTRAQRPRTSRSTSWRRCASSHPGPAWSRPRRPAPAHTPATTPPRDDALPLEDLAVDPASRPSLLRRHAD